MTSENPSYNKELCFYKLLLLKSGVFENKIININYLIDKTNIGIGHLIVALDTLLNNKIASLKNLELSGDYLTAYRGERKKFEAREQKRHVAGLLSGGSFDVKQAVGWKTYFTDKHCNLDKAIFDKLEKDGRASFKMEDVIFSNIMKGLADLKLFSYFKFKLDTNKEELKKYLDNYLDDFIKNKFNSGYKYAYTKQVQEIALAIKKMTDAGYPAESLLLDQAQMFPINKIEISPLDSRQIASISLYDFVDTVLAMEKEGFLNISDIQCQKVEDELVVRSGFIWGDTVKIKVGLTENFNLLFLKYVNPEGYEKMVKLDNDLLEAKNRREKDNETKKDPEKAREYEIELSNKRKKAMDEIYSEVDYTDRAEKQGWEDKLKICEVIWRCYISGNKKPHFEIPQTEFISDNLNIKQAENILEGLRGEKAISYFKETGFLGIAPNFFVESYQKTKDVVSKFLEEIEHVETNNKKTSYDYSDFNMPIGLLRIGNFKIKEFKKIPAKIIKFFFLNNEAGNNQKTFRDFNENMGENIKSNDFRLNINDINERVKKDTKGFVEKIIIKIENTPQEANIYKWSEIK